MNRRLAALAVLAVAGGCATSQMAAPIDLPPNPAAPSEPRGLGIEGDAIALSFSGGGARAAAFSLGVLDGLQTMPDGHGGALLDHVVLVSGVSGGAITAAYYGQYGAAGLKDFRAAYLDKDWNEDFHTSPFSPANWLRVFKGGLNGSGHLGDWLDANLYRGGAMGDLWRPGRPRVLINATDLYTGAPFAFTQPYFDAVCSDLAGVRIADAVAASMAVPVAFHPVTLKTHPARCAAPAPDWVARTDGDRAGALLLRVTAGAFARYRDPAQMRYVHLVDGGVADNLGLSALMAMHAAAPDKIAPLTPQDAVRARRLTFLVVNAEMIRKADWPLTAQGPNGVEAASAALDDAMDAGKRGAYDAFAVALRAWERDVRAFRCGLGEADVIALRGASEGWRCGDISFRLDMIGFADLPPAQGDRLGAYATDVSLPADEIDALIAGGKQAVEENAAARDAVLSRDQ
ncbi:MAG TPA: patatin-like phospholipase family protein [Caulobacterales bacterium]|nr:patatin-like phospholipase family protein [Caulobacterales bacterium]